MDMGDGSMSHACKINMLWNWYTVDACFISTEWHIRSKVAFAFTVICVFVLVALVEGVRRLGREYDRRISAASLRSFSSSSTGLVVHLDAKTSVDGNLNEPSVSKPTWAQQLVRGTFFGVQFGAAYILMLLAMYYNGYIIFAIILGGTAGHVIFGADTVVSGHGSESTGEHGASCC